MHGTCMVNVPYWETHSLYKNHTTICTYVVRVCYVYGYNFKWIIYNPLHVYVIVKPKFWHLESRNPEGIWTIVH